MMFKVGLGRYEMMGMGELKWGNEVFYPRLTLFTIYVTGAKFGLVRKTPQGLSIDDVELYISFNEHDCCMVIYRFSSQDRVSKLSPFLWFHGPSLQKFVVP